MGVVYTVGLALGYSEDSPSSVTNIDRRLRWLRDATGARDAISGDQRKNKRHCWASQQWHPANFIAPAGVRLATAVNRLMRGESSSRFSVFDDILDCLTRRCDGARPTVAALWT